MQRLGESLLILAAIPMVASCSQSDAELVKREVVENASGIVSRQHTAEAMKADSLAEVREGNADVIELKLPAVIIEKNRKLTSDFVYTNQTSSNQVVKTIHKPCSCTAVSISRDVIPSGESAVVTVSVNMESRVGKRVSNIWIEFDPTYRAQFRLLTSAYREFFIDLPKSSFVHDGMKAFQSLPFNVVLSSQDDPTLARIELRPSNQLVKTQEKGREVSRDGDVYILTCNMEAVLGDVAESGTSYITANLANGNKTIKETTALLKWNFPSPYTLEPSRIFCGYVPRGDSVKQQVKVTRVDGESVRIISATSTITGANVSYSNACGCVAFSLETKSIASSVLSGDIDIETDHNHFPKLRIPVIVRIVNPSNVGSIQ